LNICNLCNK